MELAIGEMNQRGRDTLIGSVPAPVPGDLLRQAEKLDATDDVANRRHRGGQSLRRARSWRARPS